MECKFCDVPKFGFHGNVSIEEMEYIIKNETVRNTDRFNVQRMGEPTWNDNVLAFGIVLKEVVKSCGVHPVVSTMLPRANRKLHTNLVWNQE